ncbi:hypothetical protein CMUS01_03133 [Colletotrichum musicola]|uniref:Uncharacterized protein n=1 Tax=Colletotrichum musicola TaxID=2175873 RepID=A0A8H6U6H5_9PEZI|nr:hypothetical protein CMUS01_03133 [Colletotrichum musicola]
MASESGKTQGPKATQLGKSGREDFDVFDIWQDFQTQKPTDQWRICLLGVYLIWQTEWRAAADGRNGNRVVNNKP